jgi:hypothetical protein
MTQRDAASVTASTRFGWQPSRIVGIHRPPAQPTSTRQVRYFGSMPIAFGMPMSRTSTTAPARRISNACSGIGHCRSPGLMGSSGLELKADR